MNETIEYYNNHADEIFALSTERNNEETLLDFLTHVPENGSILDLGCGCGFDSKFFVEKGYKVTLLDASLQMCEIASENAHAPYINVDFMCLSDNYKYDGIWANASLLHVASDSQLIIWKKLYQILNPGGIIYASYNYGNGSRTLNNGCYYFDVSGDDISDIIKQAGTWDNIEVWMTKCLINRKLDTFTNIFALKM